MTDIDATKLPDHAFGTRAPLWWATMLIVGIEGTMLVLTALSYFYVGDRMKPFPPWPISRVPAHVAAVELACWFASIVPMWLGTRAARRLDRDATMIWLAAATILAIAGAALRVVEFHLLPFSWQATAYGSIVWAFLGLQWVHMLTGIGENVLYLIVLRTPKPKHFVDIETTAPLWYFVTAGSTLVFVTVFLGMWLA